MVPGTILFAYTKCAENFVEEFVGGYFADNLANMIHGLANMMGHKLCRFGLSDALSGPF